MKIPRVIGTAMIIIPLAIVFWPFLSSLLFWKVVGASALFVAYYSIAVKLIES